MTLKIDPSKITTKFNLATVIVLAFEALFFLWLKTASNSNERIIAGILAAGLLVVFIYRTFTIGKVSSNELDPNASKLLGKWAIDSTSSNETKGTGELTISLIGSHLNLFGNLDVDGKRLGSIHSEVTRVNENRLIFYYVLRDTVNNENMDAVSILFFDPENPETLYGDWIVASKYPKPRHGNLTLRRIKA